jgi:hypothetical protein
MRKFPSIQQLLAGLAEKVVNLHSGFWGSIPTSALWFQRGYCLSKMFVTSLTGKVPCNVYVRFIGLMPDITSID